MIHKRMCPSLSILRLLLGNWLCVLIVGCTLSTPVPTPTPSLVVSADEEIAVLTRVEGRVTRQDINGNAESVQAFTTIAAGDRLQLAENARITVVCFADYYFTVDVAGEVEITQERCAAGTGLPANSAQRVKPDAGRIVLIEGSLALEEQARERESDYGNIPIILSPRNTSLLDLQPTITWVEVSGALEYQLSLSGLSSFDDVILAAETVTCAEESRSVPSRTCSTPWPAVWTLESGQRYFLTVSARTGIASPLRESETSALHTLPTEEAETVKTAVADIQKITVDKVTEVTLLAGLYAQHELYNQATEAYEQVLSSQPAPAAYVTLGDLYRIIELYRYAFNVYQQALNLLDQGEDEPSVRAAAEYGIGQVYYARQNFDEAEKHFKATVEIYKHVTPSNGRLVELAGTAVIEAESR